MAKIIIYACETAVQAQAAHDFLLGVGYPASGIEVTSQVATVAYDAETYNSAAGPVDERQNVWLVIGRRQ
jgi:hypothetical protein